MPTGYTADVGDGKVTEFAAFAMRCARQFGALVTMRDDPSDAPIPDEFQPSDFYRVGEAKAREEVERLSRLSYDQICAEHRSAMDQALQDRDKRDREAQAVVARYREMLAKVEAWQPPTHDHDGLKRFMVEQLTSSIDFDGPIDRRFLPKIDADPNKWHADRLAELKADVTRYAKEWKEEQERTRKRNEWVRSLRQSLTQEPAAATP